MALQKPDGEVHQLIDGKLSGEVEVDGFGDFGGDWIGTRKEKEETKEKK